MESKIPDTSGLVKETDYNSKITELESKIPNISSLAKKTNYNTKIGEINTKISTLDGKIDKSILETAKLLLTLSAGNILFDGGDGSQA